MPGTRPGALLDVLGSPDRLRGSRAAGTKLWLRLIRQSRGGGLQIASRYDRGPAIWSPAFCFAREGQIGSHRLAALAAGYKVLINQAQLIRLSIAAGQCAC